MIYADIEVIAVLFLLMLTCPQPDTAPNSTSLEQFFVLRKSAPAASGCLAVSFSQTSKAPREEDGCSAVPSFNSDGLYFTPAFILPCDQVPFC